MIFVGFDETSLQKSMIFVDITRTYATVTRDALCAMPLGLIASLIYAKVMVSAGQRDLLNQVSERVIRVTSAPLAPRLCFLQLADLSNCLIICAQLQVKRFAQSLPSLRGN
jgi:hypothetical protein